jgi:beta-alanine degradation protein BauB
MERKLGGVGTKVVFEDHRVRVWVLELDPGERIAVDPEPDSQSPYRDYFEAPVIAGMVTLVPKGGIEAAVNTGAEPFYEIIVELKD